MQIYGKRVVTQDINYTNYVFYFTKTNTQENVKQQKSIKKCKETQKNVRSGIIY